MLLTKHWKSKFRAVLANKTQCQWSQSKFRAYKSKVLGKNQSLDIDVPNGTAKTVTQNWVKMVRKKGWIDSLANFRWKTQYLMADSHGAFTSIYRFDISKGLLHIKLIPCDVQTWLKSLCALRQRTVKLPDSSSWMSEKYINQCKRDVIFLFIYNIHRKLHKIKNFDV